MTNTTTTWTLDKLVTFILAHGKTDDNKVVEELKDVPIFISVPSADHPLNEFTVNMVYNPDGDLIRVELRRN